MHSQLKHTEIRQRIKKITLIGLFSAFCITFRIIHLPIPNVQPDTDILMLLTLNLGMAISIPVAVITMILSNVILGFGIWTVPQIMAYIAVILTVAFCKKFLNLKNSFRMQLGLAVFLGFEYGLIVSWGMFAVGSVHGFWIYYLNGVLFDAYHALGNLGFYPLLYRPVNAALNTIKD